MLRSLSPGRTDQGEDYRFYNPFTARFISSKESLVVLRVMDRWLPAEYPTGWDFSEIDDEVIGSNADLVHLGASLNGWGEEEQSGDKAGEEEVDEEVVTATEPVSAPAPVFGQDSTPTECMKHCVAIFTTRTRFTSPWQEACMFP